MEVSIYNRATHIKTRSINLSFSAIPNEGDLIECEKLKAIVTKVEVTWIMDESDLLRPIFRPVGKLYVLESEK